MKRYWLLAVVLIAASSGGGSVYLRSLWQQQIALGEASSVITIAPGESLQQILRRAEGQGWLTGAGWVARMARWQGLDQRIQQGEFRISNDMTAEQMIEHLVTGPVVHYQVTIPEGVTIRAAVDLIGRHPKLIKTDSERLYAEIATWVAPEQSPEGWVLPETWSFVAGDTDEDILRRGHAAMRELLHDLWARRDVMLPLDSPYEALILASIVERETGEPSERAQIAGVFLRRLDKGMRLQTDPTVIYGLGDAFDGNLRRSHLRDSKNAYNTYTFKGLPPTPIALPGTAALRAVFEPDESDALYFVAKGDGTHAFSATLEEHELNVRKYQLNRRGDYRSAPSGEVQQRP